MHLPAQLCLLVLVLAAWDLVVQAALTPGLALSEFLCRSSLCLSALVISALVLETLKRRGDAGQSPLLGRVSLVWVVSGPLVLLSLAQADLTAPDFQKFAALSGLLWASGCLIYRVSLAESEDFSQIH
ncbi:MAG: hypothetical protein U0931_14850 [Vulcanimicrobiota bacterium]